MTQTMLESTKTVVEIVPEVAKTSGKTSKPAKASKTLAKSGKVETSLTPAEKSKRQKSLETITAAIRKESGNITSAYMRIGYRLWQVREQKLFLAVEVDGKALKNVYEYCEMAFGFKSTSAKNFISVCERFSIRDTKGNPTDKIDPAFAAFGYTQLSLMLPLDDDKINSVSPEMTASEIRELKKSDQSIGQTDEDGGEDEAPATVRKVVYDGSVTDSTYDHILDKLEKLMGKRIQIVVIE